MVNKLNIIFNKFILFSLKLQKITIDHLNTNNSDECYLDLLIQSALNLLSSGKITFNYLNQSTSPKKDYSSQDEDIENFKHQNHTYNQKQTFFSQKCENKLCGIIVDKPSDIFHTKIISRKNKSLWLCINCYTSLKNGQYCYYCNTIYNEGNNSLPSTREETSFSCIDTKTWIQCDYCKHWQHLECEEKKGKITNISKLVKKKDFKYICPICRLEKEKKQKEEETFKQNLLKKKRTHEPVEDKNKKKGVIDIRNLQCENNLDIINDFELVSKLDQ